MGSPVSPFDYLRDVVKAALQIGNEAEFARELYLNWNEARQMQDAGMLIGGHSHWHQALATMTNGAQTEDLNLCHRLMRQNLNAQKWWPFTYPYGKRHTFNQATVRGLQQLGNADVARSHADTRVVLNDDARRAEKVARLTTDLNLTAGQQKQLDDAIREAQGKFKAIRDASQPQIDATRAQARERVRAFLTPEQRPKYEAYLLKLDDERKRNGQQ
jgi:hypothetical protein